MDYSCQPWLILYHEMKLAPQKISWICLCFSKMNRSREARKMAERSIQLDGQYVPSYLLLAKLSCPARRNQLLYHVTTLVQGPSYMSFYADYLLMNRKSES